MNFIEPKKEAAKRRRRQTVVRLRLQHGLAALCRRPWYLGLLAAVLTMFFLAWSKRNQIFALLNISDESPLLFFIYEAAVSTLLVALLLLALICLLTRLGTPKRAKEFELRLMQIGLKDRFDACPVLIKREKQRGSSIVQLTFFSRGVSKAAWEQNRASIEDTLNISWVDVPRYGGKQGNNRNFIVITATPGASSERKETLYDDQL